MSTQEPGSDAQQPSKLQTTFRWLLGGALVFAGVSHLTFARDDFQAQVPRWLPLPRDPVVIGSGYVEITLGLATLFAIPSRTTIGWIAAAFFAAIFPGNISQYTNRIEAFGLDTDTKRFVRLLGQPLLIAWALWSTGAWQAWRAERNS